MSEAGAHIAALRRRFEAGEVGAVDQLRAYLEGRSWEQIESAAVLRYLLRSVVQLGLVREPHLILCATLRLLKPDWPASVDLERICEALEQGELPAGLEWPHETRELPDCRVVIRVLRELQSSERYATVLSRAAHGVALASRDAARAQVFKQILTACLGALEPKASPPHALKLLERLELLGIVTMAEQTDRRELLSRLTDVLRSPLHEQPRALGALLESSDEVAELFASDEDLARVVADW